MSDEWRRVNELFLAALERPATERRAFVAEQAGQDAALGDEVLSLLDAHERAGGFLESSVNIADVPEDPLAAAVGQTIGSYRVEGELGRGGMGVVYLAEDTRLGRKVALKALAGADSRDERRRERLRKEARAVASLAHPNIAVVFALEEIDGDLFIASEYVPGRALRAELDAGTIRVDRVLDVGVRIARGLAAAHARQIVHRDLKPENVVCGEDDVVKILDFGIARSPAGPGQTDRLTDIGTIIGTPGYMSPEQIEAQDVDSRSDIFSFGVLLYEMATGVHPFEGRTAASTIGCILAHDPRPPSQFRALPAEFDRIVRKCLQKRPGDRYQSTPDLVLDLEQLRRASTLMPLSERDVPEAELRMPPARVSGGQAPSGEARAPARRASGVTPRTPGTRWWHVHQASLVVVYGLITVAAGFARASLETGRTGLATGLFFSCIAAAALNGTLRVHLLFTERHNLSAFRGELGRARPWLRGSDAAIGLVLLALAVLVAAVHLWMAILLAAVGAASLIVSVAVEPATTDAAFPPPRSGSRRRTPAEPTRARSS